MDHGCVGAFRLQVSCNEATAVPCNWGHMDSPLRLSGKKKSQSRGHQCLGWSRPPEPHPSLLAEGSLCSDEDTDFVHRKGHVTLCSDEDTDSVRRKGHVIFQR